MITKYALPAIFCLAAFVSIPAQEANDSLNVEYSVGLQTILTKAVGSTVNGFDHIGVESEHIAATLIDLQRPENAEMASFRGENRIYPAGVVKLFYLVALEQWLEDGRIHPTDELLRALRSMVRTSSNDATGYIVDVLTGTRSGPELPEKEFASWRWKRNALNRYFVSLGFRRINVNQKTHCDGAYGVERQFHNYKGENRNMLTTNATALLLARIVSGRSVTGERSGKIMELLSRNWERTVIPPDGRGFMSNALEPGTKLWSADGRTAEARHDAAYIETPDGLKFVLVVFTEGFAKESGIIPSIVERVLKGLRSAGRRRQ